MSKHKIFVTIDGNNSFWIVVDRGKLIRNPTDEDLKDAKLKKYNNANICDKCIEEKERNGIGSTDRKFKIDGKLTWYCMKHSGIYRQRYDPNSQNNIIKSLAHRRTGNLKNPEHILADNCQECTCIWFGVKDLNKENDNYE